MAMVGHAEMAKLDGRLGAPGLGIESGQMGGPMGSALPGPMSVMPRVVTTSKTHA